MLTVLSRPQLQSPPGPSHSSLHLGASRGKPPDPRLMHLAPSLGHTPSYTETPDHKDTVMQTHKHRQS